MESEKVFDVVVFGVTGVTGKHVAREMKDAKLKWAVAGRSEKKVKEVLEEIGASSIPVIVAEVKNFNSLLNMCQSAKVLLNCVGPYHFYGEPVLKACLESSCHYLDVSGETQFMEKMQVKYHDVAKAASVYSISACGFDCIPSEMGIEYLKQNFKGNMNAVETYLEFQPGEKGYTVNFGTFHSAIHAMARILELRRLKKTLKKNLFTKKLPPLRFRQKRRGLLFYSNEVNGWCFSFPFMDQRVAARTQLMAYQLHDEKPIQMNAYIKVPSLFAAILTMVMVVIIFLFSTNRLGIYFLEKFPFLFTMGMFSFDGPTNEQVEDASFTLLLCGRGWDEKQTNHLAPPRKTMKVAVKGPDPAYVTTAICMVQAAIVILQEYEKMPLGGGVLTPGVAFAQTTLVQRLAKSGLAFHRML